ncbi:MAG: alpha/beta hydrolase [Nocardioides sp.]|nr:alpha/beta hydrolase [Nocardioides sp.]
MGYLRRQAVIAALTANALRPPRGFRAGIPAFAAGWFSSELAPHLLTLSAVDTALHVARKGSPRSRAGLALAAVSTLGIARLIKGSRGVNDVAEKALVEGLGVDYVDQLDAPPSPADLRRPWRQVVNPFDFHTEGIRVVRNIPYTDAGRRGMLDIWMPRETPVDAPVLLQVHGGGWAIGSKDDQGKPLMSLMASKGWICVAINYRLAPRNPWPAHIIDVKRAIAWIREHIGEYGGDPRYLAITGGSAGGHLTALAALTPNDPQFQPGFEEADTHVEAAVPFYGVYDWAGSTGLRNATDMRDSFLAPRIVQKTWQEAPEVYEAASPILRITPDAPDFFVLHGEYDTLVSVDQARLFVEKLKATSKHSVVYAELPGAQHAFEVFHSTRSASAVRAVSRYLNWHWNTWRHGLPVDADVSPEEISTPVAQPATD